MFQAGLRYLSKRVVERAQMKLKVALMVGSDLDGHQHHLAGVVVPCNDALRVLAVALVLRVPGPGVATGTTLASHHLPLVLTPTQQLSTQMYF